MLKVSHLTVEIQKSEILSSVCLSVDAGELVCVVGRNGAGKTTTFRTIMGYLKPLGGVIEFENESIAGLRTCEIAQRGIGFAPELSEVFADLSVAENIELPTWTRRGGRSAQMRIDLAYSVFPRLRQYLDRGGAQLSGGERKMVSIGRALALDPKLLLLDEPFEGLSPATIPIISDGICSIRTHGHGVLMAESNIHHIPDYVDRVYVLERGEIIFVGGLSDARKNRDVMRVISVSA